MRQVRHQRITSLQSNKENQLLNNNSSINSNLPILRNNNKQTFKNQYHLNLNQRKKTYLNLCTRKQSLQRNNFGCNYQNNKQSIQTTRLGFDHTLTTQLSGMYLSSRQRGDKINYKANNKHVGRNQKYQILQKHQINMKMRAKMIDWLLQITQAYKCKNQTLFLAIHLMDSYFILSDKMLLISQLHLIGVTCMYMACKYQQIHPIRMKTIVRDIAHNKISSKQIIAKQADILITLNFKFQRKCISLITQQLLYQISQNVPQSQISSLQKNLQYFIKLITFDCNLLHKQNPLLLSKAAILASIRSMPENNKNLQLYDSFITSCGSQYESSHHICSQILFLNVNFKTEFGQLENIENICPFSKRNGRTIVQSCAL